MNSPSVTQQKQIWRKPFPTATTFLVFWNRKDISGSRQTGRSHPRNCMPYMNCGAMKIPARQFLPKASAITYARMRNSWIWNAATMSITGTDAESGDSGEWSRSWSCMCDAGTQMICTIHTNVPEKYGRMYGTDKTGHRTFLFWLK